MANIYDVEYCAGTHGFSYETAFSPSGRQVLVLHIHAEEALMALTLDLIDRGVFRDVKMVNLGRIALVWEETP